MGIEIEPAALVGQSVQIWWDGNKKWYQGRVTGYNATSCTHTVRACAVPALMSRNIGLLFRLAALVHACLGSCSPFTA